MEGLPSHSGIWVFLEFLNGRVADASLELMSEARRIAERRNLALSGVCSGSESEVEAFARDARAYGAGRLLVIPGDHSGADAAFVASVLAPVIQDRRPDLTLMTASVLGKELAARVAARNRLVMIGCASFFEWRGEDLVVTHPSHQDRVSVRVLKSLSDTLVATVQAGIFPASPVEDPDAPFEQETLPIPATADRGPEVLAQVADVAADMALDEVDVVVAGGVGLGGPEAFDVLQQMADALNGRIAASRMAVDKGWIGKEYMVGQTGASVTPQLYIACGISGAMQHVAGMKESKTIVAINTDASAPIRKVADLMLVGDLHQVIPAMIDRIQRRKVQGQQGGAR